MATMTTKTYVPGYACDLFVSYALADDQPPPGANAGWVTTFVQGLQLLLTQRLGSSEEYALKTDSAAAENAFAQSATVIIILSRGYLGSAWCQRGDNPFLRVVQQRIQEGTRVFIVELDRIDLPERPPEFGNIRSYRFWVAESAEQPPRRLGIPVPRPEERRYYDLLNDLSYDLTDELRRLKALAEKPVTKDLVTESLVYSTIHFPGDAEAILKEKIAGGEYDVFLCHNSQDKPTVKQIGQQLKASGLRPWLDEWEFRPGTDWQEILEQQIRNIKSVAVCIGPGGLGPWQNLEQKAFIRQFVQRQCPVIPVILPTCDQTPEIPVFLQGLMWVDFRKADPDPLAQLIWGITGERTQIQADTRKTVFLAEATDDLDPQREEVKRYLLQANLRVLPETYYSPDPTAFQQAVRADLAKSDLFVQLLSALTGKRPPTLPQGYGRCQYDLAQAAQRPILQWRSPNLNLNEIADAAQQDFLRGHTVFAVGLEEFKAQIVKVITAPPAEPQAPSSIAGSLIFIDTDLNDASLSAEICQTLERLGAGYALPLREGKPAEVREAFKQFVLYADALMIVYGDVTPNWVIAQGLEIKKYLAQRETPPKAFVIYEGPPAPKPPIPLKFPGMRVIECWQCINEQKLREVIEAL